MPKSDHIPKRRIGKDSFVLYSGWEGQHDADMDCRILRKQGFKARLIKSSDYWQCYRGPKAKRKPD